MYCYNCKKECKPQQYRMKVIDEKGKESFQDCCSERCCNEVTKKFVNLHMDRVNKMVEVSYQRLK